MNRMRNWVFVGMAALAVVGARAGTAVYGGGSYDGYDRNDAQSSVGILSVDNANGATSVLTNSASLNGTLWDTGGTQTQVSVYWGPSDGVINKAAWTNRYDFGVCTAVQALTTNLTGLTPNTLYYYRFYATNIAGQEAWAPTSTNFITPGPPIVTADGATAMGLTTATLNGTLVAGGSSTIFLYWGEDANTTTGSTNLGVRALGPFLTTVSGLRVGSTYYYRCYATNTYGAAWSALSSFRTLAGSAVFGGGGYDGYDASAGRNLPSIPKGSVIGFR